MNDIIDKSELRRKIRVARNEYVASLSPQDLGLAFSRIPAPLDAYLLPGKIVAGYIAVGSEANALRLVEQAYEKGCATALPHVTSKTAPLRFLRWTPGDGLEDGPFGLKQPLTDAEPCDPDVVLTPLVAFDASMMRLGQGAGHYDRALSLLDNAIAVGVAWSIQQVESVPADPWDIPLDAVLTEKYWMTS